MDELEKLQQEIEALKRENAELRKTLKTIADRQYIEQSQRVVAVSSLMTAVIGNVPLKYSVQQKLAEALNKERTAMKAKIDENIKDVLQNGSEEDDEGEQFICRNVSDGVEIQRFAGSENKKVLFIPEKLYGRKVIGIGKNAFCNLNFDAVYLSDGIKYLSERAFYGCRKLETINLPDTIERIGVGCFSGTGLINIVIPNKLKVVESMCFSYCRQLKNALLNEQLEYIQKNAFEWTDTSKIIIPQNVKEIERGAFNGLPTNEKLEIAFLGEKTKMNLQEYNLTRLTVCCLSGSEVQKEAQEHSVSIKPLGEFLRN